MPKFKVNLHGHQIYQIEVDAENEQQAIDDAQSRAEECGERYLKSGELLDAWIDAEKNEES